jgi:2-methylcitrate dehydratase PrpD
MDNIQSLTGKSMTMNYTESLATFISETRLDDIPQEVLQKSKWPIIDNLAAMLAGYPEIGKKIVDFTDELGGRPVSTIVGAGLKTSAPLAAFANGTLSHALDYDDLNENMGGHPTGPVLAAILAVGEMLKSSGEELLLAYILGIETETKVGKCLIKTLYRSGWHPTAILGTLGATAACCKLLGVDTYKTVMALGIAGSLASGLKQNFGTSTKPLHVGQAAKNGVMAALLARKGWVADPNILEGPIGYCRMFCGQDNYDLKDLSASLGRPWEIADPGIKLKKYPCCGSIHPALDAMFELLGNMDLETIQIKKISCSVHPSKGHILVHPRPNTGLEAKFSTEYCLAAAILDDKVSLEQFKDEKISRNRIQALLPLVYTVTDETIPEWGSMVRVETMDGQIFMQNCNTFPKIETWKKLSEKFLDCAEPVLGNRCSQKVLAMIQDLEGIPKISVLMEKLCSER